MANANHAIGSFATYRTPARVKQQPYRVPKFFGDKSSSIGAIPSGGGHQAVRDVADMITSSVSSAFDKSNLGHLS
jgi:hypothetical protein